MSKSDSGTDPVHKHEDVTVIGGIAPWYVCTNCKLAAIRSEKLAYYPCEPDKYDPDIGEGQPEELQEERLAFEILRFDDKDEMEISSSRSELPKEARQWLESVEEYSDVIDEKSEQEKIRVAANWDQRDWNEENPE
ncbi:hypothetical protein [Halodesulfurarchaeum formicicum]|uniref:hypothetical protein n=1 Tax=Halodesulfurarchaeum formicicum TaxID=1873524 RepID=UPI0011E00C48|nr:hypothetical protein [Halodesulfurarchaeum formicicum]